MEQQLFAELEGKVLIESLDANADAVEEMDYGLKLEQDEVNELKTEFAQKSIEESRLIDALDTIKAEYKVKIKPISEEKKILLDQIKSSTRMEYGVCYKIVDRENKEVGFYNKKGQLVFSRPANMEERSQFTINSEIRKAN